MMKLAAGSASAHHAMSPKSSRPSSFSMISPLGMKSKASSLPVKTSASSSCSDGEELQWIIFEVEAPKLSERRLELLKGASLGTGASASVHEVFYQDARTGKTSIYAVKTIFDEGHGATLRREFDLGYHLRHPHVLRIHALGRCEEDRKPSCLMEYCGHGDLWGLIYDVPTPPDLGCAIVQAHQLCLFKQLLLGVSYLHRQGIAHHDIKPENLLLSSAGLIKLADFGHAVIFRDPEDPSGACGRIDPFKSLLLGTACYLPPEVWEASPYDPRGVDVWSCALTGRQILGLQSTPWECASEEKDRAYGTFRQGWQHFWDAISGGIPARVTEVDWPYCGRGFKVKEYPSYGLLRVVLAMLHPTPGFRLTIDEVLMDPCVEQIPCCSPVVPDNIRAEHDHRPLSPTARLDSGMVQGKGQKDGW
ncbi:putative serine/threonine protein kinase [Aspergillus saccharolyticus JOP 1030-1]|uniref:Kinase-like protein n=1 Tax=Aspergillus saccharolyticus JOP 1030-1 TaxID=1450539 RepID=A0A319ABF5_9EURO|nr:kinase-like protein [Aspergillus saccharolyticus JOP 1030-1]PYH48978.1 kinase-like protein [Aspergillus saccharolyticus JOP 1030-1]